MGRELGFDLTVFCFRGHKINQTKLIYVFNDVGTNLIYYN